MNNNTLAIDFGTSNSAAAILVNGKPWHIEIEQGHETLPTSLFFDFATRNTLFGNAANTALIDGRDGRFMRSLKSVLGTSLLREQRQFMDERLTFIEIIGRFLNEVKTRAETRCHQNFDYAVSGRPVHFHSKDPTRDAQALVDLEECYRAAGFKGVRFMFEPEAAALANGGSGDEGSIGLIVDIGGGTSDFTLFTDAVGDAEIEIIASHGVRVGGTNFDKSISVDHVMPLFGKGSQVRREMGPGTLTAPKAIYHDLATWEKIPFLYTGKCQRDVQNLQKLAVEKNLFERLATVLRNEIGHDIAFAVERGKIQVNMAERDASKIDLRLVEAGLAAELTQSSMAQSLTGHVDKIRECAIETLAMADCPADRVARVVFVGGSSLMGAVEQAMTQVFPNAALEYSDAFTAVVDGLAIEAARD
jgi:hypothetical chaperone protein